MRRARHQERSGYVRPSELCTPQTYVVEADLLAVRKELRGHFQRHRAEAERFARMLGLTTTLVRLLALMAPIRGTGSPGESGRGLQCPRRRLEDVLDSAQSAISKAIELGVEEGLLERYAPTRSVSAITARRAPAERLTHSLVKGKARQDRQGRTKMNVHGVLYLTARGAELVANLGTLSTFVRGQAGRKRVRTGLVGNVSKTLSNPLRAVALRCTAAARKRTPKDSTNPSSLDHSGGRALSRSTDAAPLRSADAQLLETLTAASGSDGGRSRYLPGEIDEAAACYARGIGSADHWRPDAWRAATDAGRLHLVRKFEPLRELLALLEQNRGPMQRTSSAPPRRDERPFDKHRPRPDAWWSGYGSNEHLDAIRRDREAAKKGR